MFLRTFNQELIDFVLKTEKGFLNAKLDICEFFNNCRKKPKTRKHLKDLSYLDINEIRIYAKNKNVDILIN